MITSDRVKKAAKWLHIVQKGYKLKKEQLRKAFEEYEEALKEYNEELEK